MTQRTAVAHLVCALLAVSVAAAQAGDWPAYHGSFALTGRATDVLPTSLVRLWKTPVGQAVIGTPVSDGTRIYALTSDAKLTALDLDGKPVWTTTINGAPGPDGTARAEDFTAPLLVAEGTVVAGASSGILYAFAAADGKPRWTYDVAGTIMGAPTCVQAPEPPLHRVVALEQARGTLHAVDLATGKRVWTSETGARCDGSLASADGNIVFGNCSAAFHVISGVTGEETARVDLGEGREMAGGMAVLQSVAYSGNRSGALAAADLKNQEVLWTQEEGQGELFTTPAIGDALVVFMAGDGVVYAVDRATGRTKWSFESEGAIPSSPVISGPHVVLADGGKLRLLDLATGAKRWEFAVSDGITSPAIVNGRIIVGADDGAVCAFGKE